MEKDLTLTTLVGAARDTYKVVIFDLDGTLVRLNLDWAGLKQALARLYEDRHGTPRSFHPLVPALVEVEATHGRAEKLVFYDLIEHWENAAARKETTPLEARITLLRDCERLGKKIAIFTQNFKSTAQIIADRFDFTRSIDFIVGKREVAREKPNPEGLVTIMQHFEVSSDECLFIGDSDNDRGAGSAARIHTIIV